MNLQELYEKLGQLTQQQREEHRALVFCEEMEQAVEIKEINESEEDEYYDHAEPMGTKAQVKEHYFLEENPNGTDEEFEEYLADFTVIPKGTLTLWAE